VRQTVLLDTGPLVSFLAAGLEHHEWVVEQWKRLKPPMLTREAVLTEAAFLLKREGADTDPLFALLERGVIRIALEIEDQAADLRTLMRRYRDRPMCWPTPASSAFPNCTKTPSFSPWTMISSSTAATETR
jgi:hypothetical protein